MPVSWDAISKHFVDCHDINGEIERTAALRFAEFEGISDDEMDAIDAIGSRIFRGDNAVADVKEFLLQEGQITQD